MCQAVQEMCDDARAEGRTQGFTEGESIGLQKQALLTAQKMLKDSRLHWKISLIFPSCRWMR
ncbi:hypothetical protein [Blautia massiliensis (ex Durand et al. 2017)]|uniref:hypothetical protein n=1 Tax=Blautia massiliensis (ex Durand et al. 2017) TaxID=1737424 RepID=UPI00242FDB92|nr:hypothetical protein [Blautia massiliensis (ex Durand et al. 2017)]